MWYDIEIVRTKGREATFKVHIKTWHPGFWAEAYRTLRQDGATIPEALYYTIVLILQIAKRK